MKNSDSEEDSDNERKVDTGRNLFRKKVGRKLYNGYGSEDSGEESSDSESEDSEEIHEQNAFN